MGSVHNKTAPDTSRSCRVGDIGCLPGVGSCCSRLAVGDALGPRNCDEPERSPSPGDNKSESSRETQVRQGQQAYEQVVLAIAHCQLREGERVGRAETLNDRLETLTVAFSEGRTEGVDVAMVARPLRLSSEYETLLLSSQVLRQQDSARRRAATALLCEIASRRSLPTLLAMLRAPSCPEHVLSAVLRLGNVETLERLARTTISPHVQYEILRALLGKDDPGLRAYLRLVRIPQVSSVALTAAGELSPKQIDSIFARLSASRVADRLVAAMVLAQIHDPRVTEALATGVVRNESRFEALVALAASQDLSARRFLAAAEKNIFLAATVHAARKRVRQIKRARQVKRSRQILSG